MTRLDACFEAELTDIEEIETEKGKVKVRDKKLIVKFLDTDNPFNKIGKPLYSVGVKITAALRTFEESEKGCSVHETPEVFGSFFYLTEDATMKDMRDAVENCIALCIRDIKTMFGEPKMA